MKVFLMKTIASCSLLMSIAVQGQEKIVWNGKDIGKNKTWQSQKAEAGIVDNKFQIHFKGKKWSGAGLNWEGYWPENAGVKIAGYNFLHIDLIVKGKTNDLGLTLTNNKHQKSTTVRIEEYLANKELSEKFSTVKIPLTEFLEGKSGYVNSVVWEVMVDMNSEEEKNSSVTIRKVAFSK